MTLQTLLIWAVLATAPASRVRDTAAPLPDSGVAAVEIDTLLHAVSRTPVLPPPVVTLPPVRVDAALERARRRAPTAFVTTLRADDGTRAMSSLSDALREAAGVRVTQYGGLGAFSTMSLRGAPPGQVTVLLDGVPLSSAAEGVVDLAGLPVTAVEAVEVYRGATPTSLAVPTPGGAVNLLTRAGTGARSLRLATGSFGTNEAQALWSERRGAWSLLAHGGWQGSDGDFEYRNDNGTPLEPSDDHLARRQNARFDAASVLLDAGFAPGTALQTNLRTEYFRRGQGVPGSGATPALHPRYAADRVLASSTTRWALSDAAPRAELRGSLVRSTSRLRDTNGELGYGNVDTHERFRDHTLGLEFTAPARWRTFTWALGGSVRDEAAQPAAPTAGLADPPTSSRATRAGWIAADLHLGDDRVLLHAARRWDRQHEYVADRRSTGALRERNTARTLDAPQLGARVRLAWGAELKGNWSRASRAPEFDELFGNEGAIVGNPTLVPEKSESWDAGLGWRRTWAGVSVDAEWSHHASHVRDLVLYERSSPRGARPVNVGAARLFGEEASLRTEWRGLELSAHREWLSATDRSTISFYRGRRLPQRAERQSGARLAWRGRGWTVASGVEHMGDTYMDRANFRRSPSRTLVDASLGRRMGRMELLAEGRNLGDRLVEDVAGFPLPGRTLLLSLRMDLGEHPH